MLKSSSQKISEKIKYISHKKRFQNHINSEVFRLLSVQNIPRRLKRKKPFELVIQQTTKWFSGSDLVIEYPK
jgi:hypothetical protein